MRMREPVPMLQEGSLPKAVMSYKLRGKNYKEDLDKIFPLEAGTGCILMHLGRTRFEQENGGFCIVCEF
jgi:hypothetical protein